MMKNSFYDKYIKYKKKYIQLKNQLGGDKLYTSNFNKINRIINNDMEQLLNPIYGAIVSETGILSNLYYLHDVNLLDKAYCNSFYMDSDRCNTDIYNKFMLHINIFKNITSITDT